MLEQTGLVVQDEENSDKKANHYKLADMCVEGAGDTNSVSEENSLPLPKHTYSKEDVKCGFCENFRKPSCQFNSWKDLDWNQSALGYPCFKGSEELLHQ